MVALRAGTISKEFLGFAGKVPWYIKLKTVILEYLHIRSMHINTKKLWLVDCLNIYRYGSSLWVLCLETESEWVFKDHLDAKTNTEMKDSLSINQCNLIHHLSSWIFSCVLTGKVCC